MNLSSVKARIYAYSPANAILTKSSTNTAHTIATTLPVHQNFYGGKGWDSDATDYMYGSASNTVGEVTAITASNTTPSGGSPQAVLISRKSTCNMRWPAFPSRCNPPRDVP
ncbi:hypothetical protein M5E82_05455 [Parabacteroides distasonis]|nr:hypothetical protein M5E82_05455 [Parabacteroides distasonis]